jgi:DDE superfamily endonuclease
MNTILLNYLAVDLDDRPSSLVDCIGKDGITIDPAKYLEYQEKDDELGDLQLQLAFAYGVSSKGMQSGGNKQSVRSRKKRTKRKVKVLTPYYFDGNGTKIYLRPRQTYWYMMYVKSPALEDPKFNVKFRRRFRIPFGEYIKLLEMVKSHHQIFGRWCRRDCFGNRSSPIELLLLGALRYLGRGLTFDDLEEFTAIDEETHRQFFHKFIEYGSTVLYPQFVKMPTTVAEYKASQKQYDIGGLTGCGFSTDATNVVMWRCAHNLKQANTGFKQSHPARTYNLMTNHNRRILHTTRGHPSRWNDKTLAHFDEFMCGVHEGRILQDVSFTLLSWTGDVGNSPVEWTKYAGAWGLVDNGYHKWSCTQAPAKQYRMKTEERLSEWIESFRKDAECVFGILKGRFRILKTGIRLDGPIAADRIWLTCCALHNLLLEADGLDDWNGELGLNEAGDITHAPFALQRLQKEEFAAFGSQEHERAAAIERQRSKRRGELLSDTEDNDDKFEVEDQMVTGVICYNNEGAIIVNSMTYGDFRARLVEHFDILFRNKKVRWPVRATGSSIIRNNNE